MRSEDQKFVFAESMDDVLEAALNRNPITPSRQQRKASARKPKAMAKILWLKMIHLISLLRPCSKWRGLNGAIDVDADVTNMVRQEMPAPSSGMCIWGGKRIAILESIRQDRILPISNCVTSGLNMRDECLSRGCQRISAYSPLCP